jgi:hypothetical protein
MLIALGTVLALSCAEFAYRTVAPAEASGLLPYKVPARELRRIGRGRTYIQFDSSLGWTLMPSVVRPMDGTVYQSNLAGMRADREYAVDPSPGVRRLAAFGDSFTHCDEVEYSDCWTRLLEADWPDTEVLNYGVPGYGPDQAWLRYQREGNAFRPCAVLIGYMPENINRVVNRFRPFYQPETAIFLSKPRYLLDGDGLALLPNPARGPEDLRDMEWVERELGPHDPWYSAGLFATSPLDDLISVRLTKTALFKYLSPAPAYAARDEQHLKEAYDLRGEAFEVTARVLTDFASSVRRTGATPVVVLFGRSEEIAAKRRNDDRVYEPLLDRLRHEGIATVDLTESLGRAARRTSLDRLVNGHYTRQGNEIAASALAAALPSLVRPTCG